MKVNFENITTSLIIKTGVAIVTLVIIASLIFNNYKNSYHQKVADWRKQKDHYFRTNEESPILEKDSFPGLTYFEPNIEYRVNAHLVLLHDTTPVFILRTDGKKDQYTRFAIATFSLNKKEYQLTLFKSKNKATEKVLFVPFTDKTNGEEPYKAGRYMDIELKENDEIEIDFNYAYNPFCAYNPRYSCPIPPKENFLDLEIPAGEKIFGKSE